MKILKLLSFLLLATTNLYGQAISWIGAVNNNWENPGNWSGGQVPGSSAWVYITSGSVNISGTITVQNITVEAGATLTINSGARVTLTVDDWNGLDVHGGGTVTNRGTLNVMAADGSTSRGIIHLKDGGATLNNFGTLFVKTTREQSISMGGSTTNGSKNAVTRLINNACGKISLSTNGIRVYKEHPNDGYEITNSGYLNGGVIWGNDGATLTNSGVLKYSALNQMPATHVNGSVVLTNGGSTSTPIFTYTGTFSGTVHGIYTDEAATILAGTFTTPNSFFPFVSLPLRSNNLFAKISPSGGACTYIVPFTYQNQVSIISLEGNSSVIENGDDSPSAIDHTHFGNHSIHDGTLTRAFRVVNIGNVALNFSDPRVTISGANAADFHVTQQPNSVMNPNTQTFIGIGFDPSTTGPKKAWVTISGNALNSPFTFAVGGEAIIGEPTLRIKGNNNHIVNGDNSPSTDDFTDFGEQAIHDGEQIRTFVIESIGSRSVTFTGDPSVTICGPDAADFQVTQPDVATLTPGSQTPFSIGFNPGGIGTRTALVTIANNDATRNPFSFTIQGTGVEPLAFTKHPAATAVCSDSGTSLSVAATGADSYQWQVSTDSGANYENLEEGEIYTQVTDPTLLINQPEGLGGYRYRCVIGGADGSLESAAAVLELWDCSGCRIAQPSAETTAVLSFYGTSPPQGIQTFTPTCNSDISAITVYFETVLTLIGSNLTLNVRTADNPVGRTSATFLGSASQSGFLSQGPVKFTFSQPLPVTAGTLYQFDFTMPGIFNSTSVSLSTSENYSYEGGRFYDQQEGEFSESTDLKFFIDATESLPVKLVSFTGEKDKEGSVKLKWSTAEETGFEHFEIQRSHDGYSFETTGIVKGSGKDENKLQTYHFTDIRPGSSRYYRLKMTDLDGTFSYSPLISVGNDNHTAKIGQVYPNPARGDFSYIDIDLRDQAEWTVTTFTPSGIILNTEKRILKAGTNQVVLPNLKAGLNLIRFDNGFESLVRKVVR